MCFILLRFQQVRVLVDVSPRSWLKGAKALTFTS
nr:MAG TPA: hypothetical protein [Caudoviricetes sp.]